MDNSAVKGQFTQILTAAKERRGDLAVDTNDCVFPPRSDADICVASTGIEFFAEQDSGKHKDFLAKPS